jgi:hypothetical protein
MTEEREHNPAPARTPRFCEGRVLSALAVIAVRSPMHSPRPCSHLGTFSSSSSSSVHIVAFQRRHSARDRRCWWTRCSTGERGHLRDSGAPVMAPTCWTALEDDVGWRCCALRLTLSGSTLLILRLPHDHLWPPRMRNDSKTRFVPVLLDDFLFLRLLDRC